MLQVTSLYFCSSYLKRVCDATGVFQKMPTLVVTLGSCHPHLQRALVKSSVTETQISKCVRPAETGSWDSKPLWSSVTYFYFLSGAFRFSMRAGDRQDWLTSCCSSVSEVPLGFCCLAGEQRNPANSERVPTRRQTADWCVNLGCVSSSNNATAPWACDALKVVAAFLMWLRWNRATWWRTLISQVVMVQWKGFRWVRWWR